VQLRLPAVALAAVFCVLGASRIFADASPPRFLGATLQHPAPPPDFKLRDQDQRPLRLSRQRGKVVLLTFLYTHCPDLCPLTATNLNTVLRIVGKARRNVVVLAVSVDPAGDTIGAVRRFVRDHQLLPQFHYLTGSSAALRQVWRAYRVAAVKSGGPDVDHTLYTLLVDKAGVGRVLFDSQASARTIAHDTNLLLR
jgi:protein SCO1/2